MKRWNLTGFPDEPIRPLPLGIVSTTADFNVDTDSAKRIVTNRLAARRKLLLSQLDALGVLEQITMGDLEDASARPLVEVSA